MNTSSFNFSESALIFVHIPKCGGNSFLAFLKSQLPDDASVFDTYDLNGNPELFGKVQKYDLRLSEFKSMPLPKRDSHDFIYGHMPYGLHRHISRPCQYVTIVREPVDRVVSLYWFVRNAPKHYLHNFAHRHSLVEFACSDESFELDNGQTRLLCGRYGCYNSDISDRVNQQDCDQAIAHAVKPDNVTGILGEYKNTLRLVRHHFGFRYSAPVRKNVTSQRRPTSDLTSKEIDAIKLRNEFDVRLYESVKKEFDRRLRHVPPESLVRRLFRRFG